MLALREQIRQLVATIDGLVTRNVDVFFMPQTPDKQPLLFPLRCRGAAGDVFFSVPLIFVKDDSRPAEEHYPAFSSLTDGDVAHDVAAAWNNATPAGTAVTAAATGASAAFRSIPLHGDRVDLVRSLTPQSGDVHELYALGVAPGTTTAKYAFETRASTLGDTRLVAHEHNAALLYWWVLDADVGVGVDGTDGPNRIIDIGLSSVPGTSPASRYSVRCPDQGGETR